MNTKIYFDNVPATATEKQLMELFSAHGNVVDIHVVVDRTSRESRSHGFVTMITPEGARAAIQSIRDTEVGAATLVLGEKAPGETAVDLNDGRIAPGRMMSRLY